MPFTMETVIIIFLAVFGGAVSVGSLLLGTLDSCDLLRQSQRDPGFKVRARASRLKRWMDRIDQWDSSRQIERWLRAAELQVKPAELYAFILTGALLLSIFLNLFFNVSYPVNVLFAVILAVSTPAGLLYLRRNRQRERLTEQLPSAANLIANATRAGMSLSQAFGFALYDIPEPTRSEFARVHRELQMGVPFEEAIERLVRRVGTEDYRIFAAQILIQKQAGGNVSQSLDELSKTLQDRVTLNAEIRALTAEPRMTATVISITPIFLLLLMGMLNPDLVEPLYGHPLGIITLIVFLIAVAGAFWMMRKLVDFRV